VSERLETLEAAVRVELVVVRTQAEKHPQAEIPAIGTGVFTRELDEALVSGEIDLAVHSLKDMPTELDPALSIAAVPERESPFDALVSRDGTPLDLLPPGARIGTGSPRRKAQILARRPDLEIVPLRGNVGTRLSRVREGALDGTVLAHAGLRRLGEERRVTEVLPAAVLVPAVGQGALGVVALANARELSRLLAGLDHAPSRARALAERAFLRRLRGGCQVPAGALATLEGSGGLELHGVLAALDGSQCVRARRAGAPEAAVELGTQLAEDLLARGGEGILRGLDGLRAPGGGPA
jgi:hydroxymethylbilane synthase